MKTLRNIFLQGLVAVLPISLTIYVLYWTAIGAETVLGRLLRTILPTGYYLPGLGIVAGIAVIFLAGILVKAMVFNWIIRGIESIFRRVPLVKTIYSALKDMVGFFSQEDGEQFTQVVMVDWDQPDLDVMGFVTRESFEDLPEGVGDSNQISVYIQMSYQVGGFTVLVPRENVRKIDMSLEDGLRHALTGGVRQSPETIRDMLGDTD